MESLHFSSQTKPMAMEECPVFGGLVFLFLRAFALFFLASSDSSESKSNANTEDDPSNVPKASANSMAMKPTSSRLKRTVAV